MKSMTYRESWCAARHAGVQMAFFYFKKEEALGKRKFNNKRKRLKIPLPALFFRSKSFINRLSPNLFNRTSKEVLKKCCKP